MTENEHVKTAIRWRPTDGNEDVIIEKVGEKVNTAVLNRWSI